jgi:hypothetical protein
LSHDLDSLSVALSKQPGIEITFSTAVLNILFEEKGVVVKLYSSGKALIQASMKGEAEWACSVLAQVIEESNYSNKTEIRTN